MGIWYTTIFVVNSHFQGTSSTSIDHQATLAAPFCMILVSKPLLNVQDTRTFLRIQKRPGYLLHSAWNLPSNIREVSVDRILGRIPMLGSACQHYSTPRAKFGERPGGPFQAFTWSVGHFQAVEVGTSQTIGWKCPTPIDGAATSTQTRDSTQGEPSAWRTKAGGWHTGAVSIFKERGIVSNSRSWDGPGLKIGSTDRSSDVTQPVCVTT